MAEKSTSLDILERRVLGCIKENKQTAEEVRGLYLQMFPQGMVAKVIMPPIALIKIEMTLLRLTESGFVVKEITRYTYKPLKDDTLVFSLSDKGRKLLAHKKQK